jgi:hypothetical protein
VSATVLDELVLASCRRLGDAHDRLLLGDRDGVADDAVMVLGHVQVIIERGVRGEGRLVLTEPLVQVTESLVHETDRLVRELLGLDD